VAAAFHPVAVVADTHLRLPAAAHPPAVADTAGLLAVGLPVDTAADRLPVHPPVVADTAGLLAVDRPADTAADRPAEAAMVGLPVVVDPPVSVAAHRPADTAAGLLAAVTVAAPRKATVDRRLRDSARPVEVSLPPAAPWFRAQAVM